jgi:hypothetical protein
MENQIRSLIGESFRFRLGSQSEPTQHSIRTALAALTYNLMSVEAAQAQGPSVNPPASGGSQAPPPISRFTDDAKLYIMLFVFVILGLVFVGSIIVIFATKDQEVLKFAFDTIRTLMGFFIGVATAFLGLPTTH